MAFGVPRAQSAQGFPAQERNGLPSSEHQNIKPAGLIRGRSLMLAGAAVATLLFGFAAAPASTPFGAATAVAAPADEQELLARVVSDVTYMTSGERVRQGDTQFPSYTATIDSRVAALATAKAQQLAANPSAIVPGLQRTNSIDTGWNHQREIVSRGDVSYGPTTAGYETDLYGLQAGANGAPDYRYELMVGPKEETAVGTALIPGTGQVVVVVVNGYATEPAVGPAVPPQGAPGDSGSLGLVAPLLGGLGSSGAQ